jgi:restriction endonuclease Mrr
MAIPDYQTLMRPVLEVAAEGEISVRDCTEALADRLGLSGEQRSERLASGRQTVFANRVHWAKTYLSQAGLLEMTRRGHFKATPRGLEVLRRHPQRVDNEVLMHFPEFLEFRERSRSRGDGAGPAADVIALEEFAPNGHSGGAPADRLQRDHRRAAGGPSRSRDQGHARVLREGGGRPAHRHGLRRLAGPTPASGSGGPPTAASMA